jgi:hypothetical protein
MNFQKILLFLATLILIIVLVTIGVMLSKTKNAEVKWPPVIGQCPDYWIDEKSNGEACFNAKHLGKCNIPTEENDATMNFNQSPFTGVNGICNKFKWAKSCGVTWDGITSGVSNPCNKEEPE